jgi:spore coat protein A
MAQVVCPAGTILDITGICVLDPATQPKFVNELPDALAPGFIYEPSTSPIDGKDLYEIGMYQFVQDLGLRDPANPLTKLSPVKVWGYGQGQGTYPGKTFIAQSNTPIYVKWINSLPPDAWKLLPIDTSLTWANPNRLPTQPGVYEGPIPVVPHLHGGHTESLSDGLPDAWFTPADQNATDSFGSMHRESPAVVGQDVYYYDNSQEAATIWYHDHALGITRTNVYAGLAGFYILRDNWDTGTIPNLGGRNLPTYPYEQLIVIQDRMFQHLQGNQFALYYPSDAVLAGLPPNNSWPPGAPTALPEFFGNIILVNGQAWPFLNVEPRWYRFRILNGSDSAFYELFLSNGDVFYQIGTDLGLLNSPVALSKLVIGPGERADVLLDFTNFAGQQIIMKNRAKQPYPKGATINPNTVGQIMAFNVIKPMAGPETFLWNKVAPLALRASLPAPPAAVQTRNLLLFEGINSYGRLEPMLGTTTDGGLPYKVTSLNRVTETPLLDSTEIWEIYNTTPDAHPIHLHLVDFRILNRQQFTVTQDPATGRFLGPVKFKGQPKAPGPHEAGLKDTVQTYPGEVTRIIATFDKPDWYVWHCHILSHEDHEMMRPFQVLRP